MLPACRLVLVWLEHVWSNTQAPPFAFKQPRWRFVGLTVSGLAQARKETIDGLLAAVAATPPEPAAWAALLAPRWVMRGCRSAAMGAQGDPAASHSRFRSQHSEPLVSIHSTSDSECTSGSVHVTHMDSECTMIRPGGGHLPLSNSVMHAELAGCAQGGRSELGCR